MFLFYVACLSKLKHFCTNILLFSVWSLRPSSTVIRCVIACIIIACSLSIASPYV